MHLVFVIIPTILICELFGYLPFNFFKLLFHTCGYGLIGLGKDISYSYHPISLCEWRSRVAVMDRLVVNSFMYLLYKSKDNG